MEQHLITSITLLKDWAIWMTGIQTGVIAILGTLLKDEVTPITRRWALLTLSCFVLSIFATVWLVLMLPSVLARLPSPSLTSTTVLYDISMHHLFSLRVGTVATFTHVCFRRVSSALPRVCIPGASRWDTALRREGLPPRLQIAESDAAAQMSTRPRDGGRITQWLCSCHARSGLVSRVDHRRMIWNLRYFGPIGQEKATAFHILSR